MDDMDDIAVFRQSPGEERPGRLRMDAYVAGVAAAPTGANE
jgi:hypothetical protein